MQINKRDIPNSGLQILFLWEYKQIKSLKKKSIK
jgi:hypothetical protein